MLLTFTISFVVSTNLRSKEVTVYLPNELLPEEFSYLLISLQKYELPEDERKKITVAINSLDTYLTKMKREDILFILKTEIYKEVLQKRPIVELEGTEFEKGLIFEIIESAKQNTKNLSIFPWWVLKSIEADLLEFIKMNLQSSKKSAKLITRKKLLLPWIIFLSQQSPSEIDFFFKKLIQKIFFRIVSSCEIFTKYSTSEVKNEKNDKLSYFSTQIIKLDKKTDKLSAINHLLNQISNKKAPSSPIKNIWIPRDTPVEKINFPLHNKNKLYKVPSGEEPLPINDWNIDLN